MNKIATKIERAILKIIQSHTVPKSNKDVFKIISGEELNTIIYSALCNDKPFMICRFGSTEFENFIYEYVLQQSIFKRYKWYIEQSTTFVHRDTNIEQALMNRLCVNSGFFPNDYSMLKDYSSLVFNDIPEINVIGVWRQERLLKKELGNFIIGRMEDLEPYDYPNPWSQALEGKRVLVIHPFAKTIQTQYKKREHIWENKNVLPEFDLITIQAVQTVAEEKAPFANWFEALDYMKKQMDEIEYDVAIIGCGAYGFHLAAHAKRTGHKAIHLGGATQILFGIKGKRWEELPAVSKFFNEFWVSPLPEETPKNIARVEGGCYW